MPEKFKGKKTEKAGVAVEEEHLPSFINVCDNNVILDTGARYNVHASGHSRGLSFHDH
jgi:hypothetical protein